MTKKSHPTFAVPNLGAPNRKGVKDRWRKQRGIDNKKRVKRSGYGAVPNIGYKNSDSIRHLRQDGTRSLLVRNEQELIDASKLKGITVVMAHSLSQRKRAALEGLAKKFGLNVANKVRR